jgi:3-oxo-5alpha-steroid 4-dehydrogenase
VIVIDRYLGGGDTALSGGIYYAGGGTPQQEEAGVQDDPEEMYKYLSRETQGVVSDETLREFCDRSIENLAWLEGMGLAFRGTLSPVKTSYPAQPYFLYYSGNEGLPVNAEHARPAPRGHRHVARGQAGHALFQRLKEGTVRAGAIPKLQTEVQRLVIDRHGAVVGLEALQMIPGAKETERHAFYAKLLMWLRTLAITAGPKLARRMTALEEGARSARRIRAGRGVVLATGGFISNCEMVSTYLPKYTEGLANGGLGCDGSGIRLGESVGGATHLMDRASAWRFINPPNAFARGIIVNTDGERFCNESAYGAQIGYHMCEEQNGQAWLILDQQLFREARRQCAPGKTWFFQWLTALLTMYIGRRSGKTIDELARACGMSGETLKASIDTYNAAARGETPEPFGKADDFMAELREGPYYALDISLGSKTLPCAVITFGGLVVDEKTGQVKREDGSMIPGLYAAGRTAVGIPSNHYVSGLAIADCVFSGRRAARAALSSGPKASD